MAADSCPWCGAPREPRERCARCGAIYAKAQALRAGRDPLANDAPPIESHWRGDVDERASELKLRLAAVPIALAVAALFHGFSIGHFLQRTFFTMMVHEIGHTLTAWLCGFAALPTLWRTMIAESRGPGTVLIVAATNLALLVWSARERRRPFVAVAAALLLFQFWGTALLGGRTAQAVITFGGDAGALVVGTLLMSSFFLGADTYIRRNALRWGFLVIGAAAFTDTFATWWQARRDVDAIPFGEIEGVGLSDPSKLTDVYGWTTHAMVKRYLTLGLACLAMLTMVWLAGVQRARRALDEARRSTSSN
jgi:hypothetical protein